MVSEFDLQRAREAVRKAKRALKEAERRFDTECTPDKTSSLIGQIKAAEKRVADARVNLRQIDPRRPNESEEAAGPSSRLSKSQLHPDWGNEPADCGHSTPAIAHLAPRLLSATAMPL